MTGKRQSSIEYLAEWMLSNTIGIVDLSEAEFDLKYKEAIQTAREMHRKEIEDAYRRGMFSEGFENEKEYYTETFQQS